MSKDIAMSPLSVTISRNLMVSRENTFYSGHGEKMTQSVVFWTRHADLVGATY